MRFFTTGLISALVAVATAYTTPDYSVPPSGNAILSPGLQQQVPAGQPFTITWDPTTEGLVSLVLLRGPSTNVLPLYALAENIQNTGSFQWTPSTELEPDVTHYGLLIVAESGPNKGAYQWSTQFGIENPNYGQGGSTSTTSATTVTSSSSESTVTETTTITTTTCPESQLPTGGHTSVSPVIPTVSPSTSVPVWTPTWTPTSTATWTSTSSATSAPTWTPTFTPAPPQFTGAAGRNAISLGAVAAGVAAVLAF